MNKRKRNDDKLYKQTRQEAIERDNALCVLCGARADHVHHITFRSQMGTSELSNLACLCQICHEQAHGINAKLIREILRGIIDNEED